MDVVPQEASSVKAVAAATHGDGYKVGDLVLYPLPTPLSLTPLSSAYVTYETSTTHMLCTISRTNVERSEKRVRGMYHGLVRIEVRTRGIIYTHGMTNSAPPRRKRVTHHHT